MVKFFEYLDTQKILFILYLLPRQSKQDILKSKNEDHLIEWHAGKIFKYNGISLEAHLSLGKTYIKINGKKVYFHEGDLTYRGNMVYNQYHTGTHMITLHETTFKILNKRLFYTGFPGGDKHLLKTLCNMHPGKIVILLSSANSTTFIRDELREFFYDSGTLFQQETAIGEFWAMVFHKGLSDWPKYELDVEYWEEGTTAQENKSIELKRQIIDRDSLIMENDTTSKVISTKPQNNDDIKLNKYITNKIKIRYKILYEAISTLGNYKHTIQSSPLRFNLFIYPNQVTKCSWHNNPELKDLTDLCTTYDGYGPYCRCFERASLDKINDSHKNDEYKNNIPVAIITATRLPQVLRQVIQLRKAPGGKTIQILLCVDGQNPEADLVAKILGLDVIFHEKTLNEFTYKSLNTIIAWSLKSVFNYYPNSSYAIILEDDLDLSPDFFRYFQQLSWLMDNDDRIILANACNFNSFPHTSFDPSRLYLVQSYPYYGWMIRREDAMVMLKAWPSKNMKKRVDWDLNIGATQLKGRFVIIPEISRTKHVPINGGGVHVSGFEQELIMNVRPINKNPNVYIDIKRASPKIYLQEIQNFINEAKVLNVTRNICQYPPISPHEVGGKYVWYIHLINKFDDFLTYYTISKCLGYYSKTMYEQLYGTFWRKFYQNELLIISCPKSIYCKIKNKSLIYESSDDEINSAYVNPFLNMTIFTRVRFRIHPKYENQQLMLKNRLIMDYSLKNEE